MIRCRCLCWVFLCCAAGRLSQATEPPPTRIQIGRGPTPFTRSTGEPFCPWGFNYDRDHRGRLLEEYWDTEWPTVAADFAEMKRLGANTIRVHLQVDAFFEAPYRPNPRALDRLARLLRLAERTGLYLNLTGLGCYRRSRVPLWYEQLDEAGRWHAQTIFWTSVARVAARSPAVFCYNLMNEPFVPGTPRAQGGWLAGEFGGFSYVQAITLDSAGRPRVMVARQWIQALAGAIRSEDPHALITVGLLPETRATDSFSGFDPAMVAEEVDFLSVHLYPRGQPHDDARQVLETCSALKPVVVEETFPLHLAPVLMTAFVREHRRFAAGWLTFYWGQPPEELATQTTFEAVLLHDWLVRWQILGRCLNP